MKGNVEQYAKGSYSKDELLSEVGNRIKPKEKRLDMSKILIVEDNEMNRDMLSRRLIRKGFIKWTRITGVDISIIKILILLMIKFTVVMV